jgi:hypothetical protein
MRSALELFLQTDQCDARNSSKKKSEKAEFTVKKISNIYFQLFGASF